MVNVHEVCFEYKKQRVSSLNQVVEAAPRKVIPLPTTGKVELREVLKLFHGLKFLQFDLPLMHEHSPIFKLEMSFVGPQI